MLPKSLSRFIHRKLQERRLTQRPNLRGAAFVPPGHFYSPLLNIECLGANDTNMPFDGVESWEYIDLRHAEQKAYYDELLSRFPFPPFPVDQANGHRYFTNNTYFLLADAFTLSGIIQKEKPHRIIEVGSGFSSAVMLDTLAYCQASAKLTFVDPFPERLYSLLTPADRTAATVFEKPIQELSLSVFDQLEAQDILFIDSSHVCKVGSDVAFIILRVLPRLKPGVFVHFHDLFYPFSYPIDWIREGNAWNESLFLRAFLLGNPQYQITAFNSYAGHAFPEVFRERLPSFLKNTGGSMWIQKVA